MSSPQIPLTEDFYLSSQFPDITMRADGPAQVEMKIGTETFFSQTYYPDADGHFVMGDVASLVSAEMENRSLDLVRIDIVLTDCNGDSVTKGANVLYCNCEIDTPEDGDPFYMSFLPNNFLTSTAVRIVNPDFVGWLRFLLQSAETAEVHYFVTWSADGKPVQTDELEGMEQNYAAQDDPVIIGLTVDIPRIIASVRASLSEGKIPTIHSLQVRAGNRSAMFYTTEKPLPDRFVFRNMFGSYDFIQLSLETVEKRKTEVSTASVGRFVQTYDRHTEQSFEATASGLDTEQAVLMADMLASSQVFKSEHQILITDASPELKIRSTDLNQIKFTYRYSAVTPSLRIDESGKIILN